MYTDNITNSRDRYKKTTEYVAFLGYVFVSVMTLYLARISDVTCKDIGSITIDLGHIEGSNPFMTLLLPKVEATSCKYCSKDLKIQFKMLFIGECYT
jgi:hypothetical protein